ncbi:hypothetical protein DFH07DRAFT_767352 [Mycena maculata]|uniref:Uncharacterized protein n=1 Tax=Mycena maculata TaxID=230809 RepID=A0AAD7NSR8_9AGAR|nr:hypothetical protein DFH07DRAFT_767352 [Mycena maculata]
MMLWLAWPGLAWEISGQLKPEPASLTLGLALLTHPQRPKSDILKFQMYRVYPDPGPLLRPRVAALVVPRCAQGAIRRAQFTGKVVGKDVGMWFGASAAAGAVGMPVNGFPAYGLGISILTYGILYQTEVYTASHSPAALTTLQASTCLPVLSHGHRLAQSALSLLLGIRGGLNGVNPIHKTPSLSALWVGTSPRLTTLSVPSASTAISSPTSSVGIKYGKPREMASKDTPKPVWVPRSIAHAKSHGQDGNDSHIS